MMKKFLFSALCLPLLTCSLATAKEHSALKTTGEICTAVNDNNPDNRLESLLQILAAKPGSFGQMAEQLRDDLAAQPFSAAHLAQLQKALKQTPENFLLAELTANYMRRSGAGEAALLAAMTPTAQSLDFAKMDQNTLNAALQWCQNYLRLAANERDFNSAEKALTLWLAKAGKYRHNLLITAGDFYALATVLTSDFTAADPRWKELPANKWKTRCAQTVQELKKFESSLPQGEAKTLLDFYSNADHKEGSRFAKELMKRFPLDFPPEQVFIMTMYFNDISIYDQLPEKSKDPAMEIWAAIITRQFERARNGIRQLDAKYRPEFDLAYACATGNRQNIEVMSSILDKQPLRFLTILQLIEAASQLNSPHLLYMAWEKGENLQQDVIFANAYAYVASCLGVDMTRAGQLLEYAHKIAPDNSAILDSIAYYHFKRKDFARASKFIQLALRKLNAVTNPATMLLHAADIELAYTNDRAKAAGYLRRALKCRQPKDREFDLKRAKELEAVLL